MRKKSMEYGELFYTMIGGENMEMFINHGLRVGIIPSSKQERAIDLISRVRNRLRDQGVMMPGEYFSEALVLPNKRIHVTIKRHEPNDRHDPYPRVKIYEVDKEAFFEACFSRGQDYNKTAPPILALNPPVPPEKRSLADEAVVPEKLSLIGAKNND